jgi:glycosyltransferase involved in cell wall biosynthesis
VTRLLVVNSGLLGASTFGTRLLPRIVERASTLRIQQVLLTAPLTLPERIVRRAICQRLWTDKWPALSNLDLARYRHEWHTGLLARRRLRRLGRASCDAILFYRQPAAYASLSLMRSVPSIVAIDCTQDCVGASFTSALARATLAPGIHHDGLVFEAATTIVSSSHWAAASARAMYPRCRTPIEILAPPVDLAAFDENWIAERAARAAAGSSPTVLFVGGDFQRKGGFALLRAWRDAGLGAHARLALVTDWPLAERDLPPAVVVHRGVHPYSERWRELWRTADVFAMPTRYEAFGMVFQEAAAAGLPRIGTRENAGPELIHDGADGVLVEPGDSRGLVRAIATLVRDAGLRQAMGRAARTFIAGSASLESHVSLLERLVERAIALHEKRARVA